MAAAPGPAPEATPPAVPDAVCAPAPPAAPAGHLRSLEITPAGRTVAAAAVVTYVVGVVLGYDQLLVLASAGILVLAAATVFIAWRPRVEVTREFRPSSVTAGQAAAAVLTVNNLSRWPSPPIRVADRLGHQDIELPIRVLAPAGSALVRYPLPTLRRGRVGLGPLRVLRSDPFDLLRRRQPGAGLDVLWVHPRTWPLSPLPAGVIVDFEGPISETGTEGSLTFSSLREYVAGDDRRQIHWKSSARLGRLLVRRNVDANEPRATVVLDTRPDPWDDETFEAGVEVAASAVRSLSGAGHPVELRILGERRHDPRLAGATSPADQLAAVEREPAATTAGLYALLEQGHEGGALVVVTGRIDSSIESRVSRQIRRFAPVVLCSVAPDRAPRWQRRSGIHVISGPSAPALAEAWNRMFGH